MYDDSYSAKFTILHAPKLDLSFPYLHGNGTVFFTSMGVSMG